jgi:hypothetical protein
MARRAGQKKRFVVCVRNTGYPASLELPKLYQAVPDAEAESHGLLRIIDESGEDYLYPRKFFMSLDLPHSVLRGGRIAAGCGMNGTERHIPRRR